MGHQKIGVIIQARMGSTRLPGKILLELDKNEKILDVLIKRLKLSKLLNEIIIATTPDDRNYAIIDTAKQHNVSYFIGSEDDVLERYFLAAKEFKLNVIIRVTSDCPFVDPYMMDDMIKFYINNSYDYVKNFDEKTQYTRGFEIEIFGFNILEQIYSQAISRAEREHVTYYLRTHFDNFKIFNFNAEYLNKIEGLRLTIDKKEDLLICREIYKKMKKKGKPLNFSLFDIYELINEKPELMNINKHVQHKKIS